MTAIAGVAQGGKVWIGADSAGVADWALTIQRAPKVFLRGPYIIGYSSSFRMGQILEHSFEPPAPPRRRGQLARFMVVNFVDALRAAFKTAGWGTNKDGREWGGFFLVGARGRLFRIEDDFQVSEAADCFDAVGCGSELARGALYATRGQAPRKRVDLALRAAERCNAGVRGPFHVLEGGAR